MIRLLVVDEVRLVADAFVSVLGQQPDIQVVGSATDVSEALALVEHCNMVLVSTRLPHDGALQLTRTVASRYPSVHIVVVGLSASTTDILHYVETGALGYILKEDSLADMLGTLRSVHSREARVSPDMAAVLMSRVAQLAEICKTSGAQRYTPATLSAVLTRREREVLRLMAQDLSNAEIAAQLTIELGTVKNHVHKILAKLNVSSRRDAVSFLAQRKLALERPARDEARVA
ncbi:MAG: response regulator transcription factor [Chloroflexi bacterium]|nr:MAG: response regulator transcription factor [Chloroflexota bacterium]